jgi:hypothetical protein
MFDRLVFPTTRVVERGGPSRVEVHEHRAPTEEAARLYRECLEQARAEVVSTTLCSLEDNVLSHARCQVRRRFDTFEGPEVQVWFRLNGRDHTFRFTTPEDAYERMAKKIVAELTRGVGEVLQSALPGKFR